MCVSQEVPLTLPGDKVIVGLGFSCPQQCELTGLGSSSLVLPAAIFKQG